MLDVYDKLPTSHQLHDGRRRTEDVLAPNNSTFMSLLLEPQIQNGLAKCGFVYLSPIQKNALPLSLTGTSIIAHAKSGTGKTLVYVLTVLNNYLKKKSKFVSCLILSPTREIAKQTYDVFKNVAHFIEDIKIEYFIGGTPIDMDVVKSRNCHVAIGAPGRIRHLIELGSLKLDKLEILVMDEVDALLDQKEFAISRLVSHMPSTKQTIVCTATFSSRITHLLSPICSDMEYVTAENVEAEVDVEAGVERGRIAGETSNILIGVKQYVATVFKDSTTLDAIRKRDKLIEILRNFEYDQCFVFVNYVSSVKSIFNLLVKNGFEVSWISSEQIQSERLNAINQLKLNRSRILVTTDVASRGIDVHNVNLVVNLGIPCPPNVYIHRMGRAGRYGSEGAVVTIVHEGDEMEELKNSLRVVSTDVVNLIVLPKQVTKNLPSDGLEVVVCEPRDTCDQNDEVKEHFGTKGSDWRISSCSGSGNNTGTKKKKKKKKKKTCETNECGVEESDVVLQAGPEKPLASLGSSFGEDLSVSVGSGAITDDNGSTCPVGVGKLENRISRYVNWLRAEMDHEDVPVDSTFLRSIFAKEELEQECEEEKSKHRVDDSVIRCARFVMEKNAFLDDQRFPCSIDDLVHVQNKNIFVDRRGDGDIRDAIRKIYKLGLPKCPSLSPTARHKVDSSTSNRTRAGFSSYSLADELYSANEKSSKHERSKKDTSEERTARSKIISPTYTGKNAFLSTVADTPVTQPVSDSNDRVDMSDPFAKSSVPFCKGDQKHSQNIESESVNIPAATEFAGGSFTKQTATHCNSTTPLPSLRSFVDPATEHRIWKHHLNFIKDYVRRSAFENDFIVS